MKLPLVTGLLLASMLSCADIDAFPEAVIRRDSAGIAVIENRQPLWTGRDAWGIVPDPALSIGLVEGEPPYLLSRIAGARRLADGRLVVANGGTQELRFYDLAGLYLGSVGGPGDGPGEFRGIRSLYRMQGDSILVIDALAGRFSVLDPQGRFITSYAVPWGRTSPQGRFEDGQLLSLNYADPELAVATGAVRVPVVLVTFRMDGQGEDTIAVLPGDDEFRVEVSGGLSNYSPPFARSQSIFVQGGRIYSGTGDRFEIQVRRQDGSVDRLIRAAVPARTITTSDVDAWRQSQFERATERSRPAIERLVRDAPVPTTMPAFSSLQVDSEGNLWVRGYAPPGEELSPEWQIFDSAGRWLGAISLPERFAVAEIGTDYVLGMVRDSLDVEYVRLHRIAKP